MKKLLTLLAAFGVMFYLSSCGDDDDNPPPTNTDTFTIEASTTEALKTVTGTINRDITFGSDTIWVLNGRVIVGAGATLTIEEGTIVKGEEGQDAQSSLLLVARDATIEANGTANNPIIFTSVVDDIAVGEFASQVSDFDNTRGLWGGVIVLGNAPISSGSGAEDQIEGIPSSVTEGLYGGTTSNDDSGSLTYISIRFTGTQLGPGNELQGLTLGGVGSGTVINHVESINSADDGIEIFGGTVNVSNFIVWGQDDDGYDIDQGWSGTIDNFVHVSARGDHPLEIDGPEGSANGQGTLTNGSVRGLSVAEAVDADDFEDEFADLRDGAQINLNNIYFFNFESGADLEIDADGADDPASSDPSDPDKLSNNPAGSDNYVNNLIELTSLEFLDTPNDAGAAGPFTLVDIFSDKWSLAPATEGFDPSDTRSDADAVAQAEANETKFVNANGNAIVATGGASVGANVSVFGWSYTQQEGALDDF